MRALRWSSFIACVCLVSSQVISRDVTINQGTVRGYNDDNVEVMSFYGIPYASTPRGEDRFKGPLPPPTWSDVFNATSRNIVCPQPTTSEALNRTMDCLIVNIFSPITEETNLPVIVYIHGGGFREGYGQSLSPVHFAAKGVVAVTLNYRLGVFGFLCLGTEFAPGNGGMKDQAAAMKWVKQNIAQFGGDPNNILLAGSSAGAMAVEFQILSPMSNGLFDKAASESGSALANNIMNLEPLGTAESFANSYGVVTGQDINQLEQFFRSLTDEQMNDEYQRVGTDVGFVPCVETHNLEGVEKFLEAPPSDILRSGNYQKRPYLTGFTTMEGLTYIGRFDSLKLLMEEDFSEVVPTDLTFESENDRMETAEKIKDYYFPSGKITNEGFVDFYTDSIFAYPQLVSARLHSRTQSSVPVYLYLWNFNGTINLPPVYSFPIWGPGHIAQSLYLLQFEFTAIYDNMSAEDFLLQDRIQDVYVNFIRYGNPIPSPTTLLNSTWPPVTAEALNFLEFDVELSVGQSPLKERLDFWDQIYAENAANLAARNGVVLISILGSLLLMLIR